ncbi:hypothetical protein GW943_02680 [Candidatus Parcubacteria bacterium]|nr:hypothetical protein [Candidatus Parcubacteria bacterium]
MAPFTFIGGLFFLGFAALAVTVGYVQDFKNVHWGGVLAFVAIGATMMWYGAAGMRADRKKALNTAPVQTQPAETSQKTTGWILLAGSAAVCILSTALSYGNVLSDFWSGSALGIALSIAVWGLVRIFRK